MSTRETSRVAVAAAMGMIAWLAACGRTPLDESVAPAQHDEDDVEPPWEGCVANGISIRGALCASGPCVMLDDEVLGTAMVNNDVPSITFDGEGRLAVLAEQPFDGPLGFAGVVWRESAEGFHVEDVPFRVASGTLATGPPGPLAGPLNDGHFGSAWLVERQSSLEIESLPYDGHFSAGSAVRDERGRIHTIRVHMAAHQAQHVIYDGDTQVVSVESEGTPSRGTIALAPDGTPHLAWTRQLPGANQLRWWRQDGEPETVVAAGIAPLCPIRIAVAQRDGEDVPFVLFSTVDGALALAGRVGAQWLVEIVMPVEPSVCASVPPSPGAECVTDFASFEPLAVFATDVDLRFVYTAMRGTAWLVSDCNEFDGHCQWFPHDSTSESSVEIGTVDAEPTTLLHGEGSWYATGTAVVAPDCTIYAVAATEQDPPSIAPIHLLTIGVP